MVDLSFQIPLCLLSQKFNVNLLRELLNLNFHVWLLQPRISVDRKSANRWQRELTFSDFADFFMYVFQERSLQPSTMDSYKAAIADKVEKSSLYISKTTEMVLRCFLLKPFEPLRKASLKHLIIKTVFLLTLGLGSYRN